MTDNVENLTHEMLRRVHSKLDEIQTEMRLRFTGIESGLAALDHHLAAFHLSDVERNRGRPPFSGEQEWKTS